MYPLLVIWVIMSFAVPVGCLLIFLAFIARVWRAWKHNERLSFFDWSLLLTSTLILVADIVWLDILTEVLLAVAT